MPKLLRSALLITLVIALMIPTVGYAQDDETQPVTIQGTMELENLVMAIRDAYLAANPDSAVEIDPAGGMTTGFDALCNGTVDMVMATEPMTDEQIAACAANGQDFIETVLAYEVVVLVAPPTLDVTCLALDQVQDIWQLGGADAPNWLYLGSSVMDTAIEFYGPNDLDSAYLLFSNLVPAGDLREDITLEADPAAIIAAVSAEESSAMGFMSLAAFEQANTDGILYPLDVMNAEGQCTPATVSTVSSGEYPLARTDYLYVNAARAQNADVQAFLQFALETDDGVKAIGLEQGFTLADLSTYEYGLNNVITGNSGRTFTRPASPVTISSGDAGTLSLVGTSMLNDMTASIQSTFAASFPNAVVTADTLGNENGWTAFCQGEADVLQTTRAANQNDIALCYANDVEYETVALGYEALVVAVPEAADWIDCLTAAEAAVLFRAGTDETPAAALWSDINPDWPETEIVLVQPPLSDGAADFLTYNLIGDLTMPFRTDGLENADADYRLVGVGNTDNGLTYAWWTEYASAPDAPIKLLGIGDACVVPAAETLMDGTYPLGFPANIHISRATFTNPMVRAFLWHLYSDTSIDTLASFDLVGFDATALQDANDAMFNMLADYEATMPVEGETVDEASEDTAEDAGEDSAEETSDSE
ncbi:MAG: substrate-binding domain-containing protein [Anaerolineae bacterium]|nr:substrate-binding domain-containing protein [Anaerolineae bacterium]